MRMRTLGGTGIAVSEFCLGSHDVRRLGKPRTRGRNAGAWWTPRSTPGINFIDTADEYSSAAVEEIVGNAPYAAAAMTSSWRPSLHHQMREGHQLMRQLPPLDHDRLVEDACDGSGTDRIDLYQVHRPDPTTDIDENQSRAPGPRASGQGSRDRDIGLPRGADRRVAVDLESGAAASGSATEQLSYSILARGMPRRPVLPTAERHGLGVLVRSPLNGGWLSGRYRRGSAPAADLPSPRATRHPDYFDMPRRDDRASQARSRRGARCQLARRRRTDPAPARARIRRVLPSRRSRRRSSGRTTCLARGHAHGRRP